MYISIEGILIFLTVCILGIWAIVFLPALVFSVGDWLENLFTNKEEEE